MNACHIVGGDCSQGAVSATASPPPRWTLGSPASWVDRGAKYLILKADGILGSHNRSQRLARHRFCATVGYRNRRCERLDAAM